MATGYGEFAKGSRQGSLSPQQWNAYLMQRNQIRSAYKQAFNELQTAAQQEGLNIAPPQLNNGISQAEAQEKLKAYAEQVNKDLSYFDVDVQLSTVYKSASASGLNVPRPTMYGKTVKDEVTAKVILDNYTKRVSQIALQKGLTDAVNDIRAQAAQHGVTLSGLSPSAFVGLTEERAQYYINGYLKNANNRIATKNYNEAVNSISAQAIAQGVSVAVPSVSVNSANAQTLIDQYAANVNNALLQKSVSGAVDSIYVQAKGYGVEVPKPSLTGVNQANAQAVVDSYLTKVNKALESKTVTTPSVSSTKVSAPIASKVSTTVAKVSTPAATPVYIVHDDLGREHTVTQSQLQQMQKAQASRKSSENFTLVPEEVANSKSSWWINSNGLYEWTPVTASDKAHLDQINKQRAYLKQSPKTTLTCGASPSEAYSKEWYSTGGNRTQAKVGSGDLKLQKIKASSPSINNSASAKTGTAQQVKAKVVAPKKIESKTSFTLEPVKTVNAKTTALNVDKKIVSDVKEFKTVSQIAQDAAVAKALAEAHKINPKGSKEYFEGVANVARRNQMSTTQIIKEDINHARTQASKAVSSILPDLDTIAKTRDKYLSNVSVKVTQPGKKTREYTLKDVQRKQQKAVKSNVATAGLLKFTEDEYNYVRNDPLKYAAETGVIMASGAAFGAGAVGLKAVVNPRLAKVAGKAVGKHGVDVALIGVPAVVGGASVYQYFKSDDYKALSDIEKETAKVQMVAGGFRTLKDFAIASPGFKAGSKAMEGTISKVKAMRATPSTVKINKPSGLENALPSEFDITNVARNAPKARPRTVTDKVVSLKRQVSKLEAKGKESDKPKIKQLKQQINAIEQQKKNTNALASMKMKNRADIKETADMQAFDSELAGLRRMKAFADEYSGSALRARPTESDLSKALDTFTPSEIARIDGIKTGFSGLKPKAKPMTTSRTESLKALKSLAKGTGKASSKKASQAKAGIKEAFTPKYKPSVETVGKARNPNFAIAESRREGIKLRAQARRIEDGLEKARIEGDVSKEALYSARAAKFKLIHGISTKKASKINTGKSIPEKTLGQKRSEHEVYRTAHKNLRNRGKSQQSFQSPADITDISGYARAFENSPAGQAKAVKSIHKGMKRALKGAKKDKAFASKPKDVTDVKGYRRAKTDTGRLTIKDLALYKARNTRKYNVNNRNGNSWDSFKEQVADHNKQVEKTRAETKKIASEVSEDVERISEPFVTTKAERQKQIWERAHERLVRKNAKAKEAKREYKNSDKFKEQEEKHNQAWERTQKEKSQARELEKEYRNSEEYKAKEEDHFNKWVENQKQKTKKREELSGKKSEQGEDHFKAWEQAQKDKTQLKESERAYRNSDEYKAKEDVHFEAWMRSQKAKMEKREFGAASQRQEILQSTQAGRETKNISFDLEAIAKEVEKAGLKREDKFLAAKKKTQQSFGSINKKYSSGSTVETNSGSLKLLQKTETVAKQIEVQKQKRTHIKVSRAEQKTKTQKAVAQKTKVISKRVKPERSYFRGMYLPVSTVDGYEYTRYPATTPSTIAGFRSIKQVEQVINSIGTTLKTSPETPVKPKIREITRTYDTTIPRIKPHTITQERVRNDLNVPVVPRTEVKPSTMTPTKVDPVIKNIIKEVTVVTGITKITPGYKVRVPPQQKGVIAAGKKPHKQPVKAKDPKGIARYMRKIQNDFGNLETMFGKSTARPVKKTVKKAVKRVQRA